jgi:hypothetical protein
MSKHLENIPWQEHDSTNINATFYDEPTGTLCVRFNSGGVYSYMAPHDVYVDFIHASSMGGYLHDVIKAYPYTRWESEMGLLMHLNV